MALETSARWPSGVSFTRIGMRPPESKVAITSSVAGSMTETVCAPRLVTHTSPPSGDTSTPSAPSPVGTLATEPSRRSMTVAEPEPMLAT